MFSLRNSFQRQPISHRSPERSSPNRIKSTRCRAPATARTVGLREQLLTSTIDKASPMATSELMTMSHRAIDSLAFEAGLLTSGGIEIIRHQYLPWLDSVSHSIDSDASRYVRSYHIEAELRLLQILERQTSLGEHQPHASILKLLIDLLISIATRLGPFQSVLTNIAKHLEQGIFDSGSTSFYDIYQAKSLEYTTLAKANEKLHQNILSHNANDNEQQYIIKRLQDVLTNKIVEVKLGSVQLREKNKIIQRLTRLLGRAQKSVSEIEHHLQKALANESRKQYFNERLNPLNVINAPIEDEKNEVEIPLQNANNEKGVKRNKIDELMNAVRERKRCDDLFNNKNAKVSSADDDVGLNDHEQSIETSMKACSSSDDGSAAMKQRNCSANSSRQENKINTPNDNERGDAEHLQTTHTHTLSEHTFDVTNTVVNNVSGEPSS